MILHHLRVYLFGEKYPFFFQSSRWVVMFWKDTNKYELFRLYILSFCVMSMQKARYCAFVITLNQILEHHNDVICNFEFQILEWRDSDNWGFFLCLNWQSFFLIFNWKAKRKRQSSWIHKFIPQMLTGARTGQAKPRNQELWLSLGIGSKLDQKHRTQDLKRHWHRNTVLSAFPRYWYFIQINWIAPFMNLFFFFPHYIMFLTHLLKNKQGPVW